MLTSIVRLSGLLVATLLAALLLQWLALPAGADGRADVHAALKEATAQYRVALLTLETSGREETSAEVARFRAALQAVIDRFDTDRSALGDDQDYAGLFMQLDARILGAMIVIDIGSREAARDALAPIGETLSELSARSAPAE